MSNFYKYLFVRTYSNKAIGCGYSLYCQYTLKNREFNGQTYMYMYGTCTDINTIHVLGGIVSFLKMLIYIFSRITRSNLYIVDV